VRAARVRSPVMRAESGQASVEWVGLVLLLALGLAALVRFAPRADAEALGPELLHAIGCAASGRCDAPQSGRAASDREAGAAPREGAPPRGEPRRTVSAPPLVPIAPHERPAPAAGPRALPLPVSPPQGRRAPPAGWRGLPGGLLHGRALLRGRALARRAGRGAGLLWRRSWVLCLGYERVRYGVLHPEIRYPQMPVPLSEDLRMVNDCLSPVDLVRDWDLIRGPR
jgi:hypothetical protein